MTAKTRQQLLILLALIVVGVIVVVAMRPAGPTAETITGPSNRSGRGGAAAGRTVPVVDVKLELLDRAHDEVSGPERNPFRFQPKAPPPSAVTRPAPRPEPVLPPQPEGPPPPPPILLRFIGFVQTEGNSPRIGLLSDGRGNVFHAKEGDIIEGRYRVLRIGTDSAELVYLDGRGRQTIRLSGQ